MVVMILGCIANSPKNRCPMIAIALRSLLMMIVATGLSLMGYRPLHSAEVVTSAKSWEIEAAPLPRSRPRSTFCATSPSSCAAGTILYPPHTRENPGNVPIEVPAPLPHR
jgi:hypothetical protein